jgi:hypothetical protein
MSPSFYSGRQQRTSSPTNHRKQQARHVVLPITVFAKDSSIIRVWLFGSDQRVVAMLAEIFMVKAEAEARLVDEVLPSSRSRFIPLSPCSQFDFKETDPEGAEALNEDRPTTVVRKQRTRHVDTRS